MNKAPVEELLKNYTYCKSRKLLLEKEIAAGRGRKKANGEECIVVADSCETELAQLVRRIETVDTCLNLLGEYDSRCKTILEDYYIHNVRIEDIAERTHLSRTRCYELCSKAVGYMSRIVFGDGWQCG